VHLPTPDASADIVEAGIPPQRLPVLCTVYPEAKMARLLLAVFLLSSLLVSFPPPPAEAGGSVYVRPHVRSNGTYVSGHYRSAPGGNVLNNWSTPGNVNPYTGERGTVDPYRSNQSPSYGTLGSSPERSCTYSSLRPC
jgi:hypothetical protein